MPRPGFEPGLLRPQRRVLTTRRSRLHILNCYSKYYESFANPFKIFTRFINDFTELKDADITVKRNVNVLASSHNYI
jgi:hypothetical protein